jgi:hypothetical protein
VLNQSANIAVTDMAKGFFVIDTPKRKYNLQAMTSTDCQLWVDGLNAIKKYWMENQEKLFVGKEGFLVKRGKNPQQQP